jgi:uncharacterized membrane protein YhaH (DUF805 family)
MALIWILLAGMAKRYQDAGFSGWWVLSIFIPILGQFTPMILLFWPGTPGPNRYGPERPGYFVAP